MKRGLSNKKKRGFTIVELLIVIVVIAVLASITVTAYAGIQQRARNTARVQAASAILKSAALYKAEHGEGALRSLVTPVDGQCIGSNYQNVSNNGVPTCRWTVPAAGEPSGLPVNESLYEALQSSARYSMNYEPVTQSNFSGISRITSSAPFLAQPAPGIRATLDGGSIWDSYLLLSYRLEGVNQNCQLPVVRITSETDTLKHFTSGFPYSVVNGGATECWVWLEW